MAVFASNVSAGYEVHGGGHPQAVLLPGSYLYHSRTAFSKCMDFPEVPGLRNGADPLIDAVLHVLIVNLKGMDFIM